MGRALEFDYDEALDRATMLFWKGGYSGTSLRALLRVMGIGEGSFYNTLKSKKCLYLECLKHYDAKVYRVRLAALAAAPSAGDGFRALFRGLLDGLDEAGAPRACMLAASVNGEVLADPDLREYVLGRVSTLVDALAARLAVDRVAGRLPADLDPEVVASIVVTFMQGLFQAALASYDRPRFERQVDVFLRGLGL